MNRLGSPHTETFPAIPVSAEAETAGMARVGREGMLRRLVRPQGLLWVCALALGGLHTWAAMASHSMNPDGVSYLDIGDAYARGDWATAINGVWSPFYSWILGAVLFLIRPSMAWEFPLVHAVNFAVYLVSLVAFAFFWQTLQASHHRGGHLPTGEGIGLPDWAWQATGYLLFIWTSLHQIQIWSVTPDMLMSIFVYLSAGLAVRMLAGDSRWRTSLLLGLSLGAGYLAKTPMLPIGAALLLVIAVGVPDRPRMLSRLAGALLLFITVIAPYVTAISLAKGSLTFGDAGSLTYVRHVNGVVYPHWQGESGADGMPLHPSRRISEHPAIYEFAEPIDGTYPINLNPAYWYEGVEVRLDWRAQLGRLLESGVYYYELFLGRLGVLTATLFLLYWVGRGAPSDISRLTRRWGLTVVALAGLAMYAPVLVAGRYVGVFVVLFWANPLTNVTLPRMDPHRRLAAGAGVLLVACLLGNIAMDNFQGLRAFLGISDLESTSTVQAAAPSWPGETAAALQRLGIRPGDQVAVVGYGFDSFWARLARVRIVAELLEGEADALWLASPDRQAELLAIFADTGAQAVVAEHVPEYAHLPGWDRVGRSSYHIYVFR